MIFTNPSNTDIMSLIRPSYDSNRILMMSYPIVPTHVMYDHNQDITASVLDPSPWHGIATYPSFSHTADNVTFWQSGGNPSILATV
jgi:hypothetical protein